MYWPFRPLQIDQRPTSDRFELKSDYLVLFLVLLHFSKYTMFSSSIRRTATRRSASAVTSAIRVRFFNSVYILSGARTPIGNFQGGLKTVSATDLGATAAKAAVERAGIKPSDVDEVIMGHVISGDCGQAPARQVGIKAGMPFETEATGINKVCASGLKAVSLGAMTIETGDKSVILAGGMESMSQTPYYVTRNLGFGDGKLKDSIINDGLTDVYDKIHMGNCCENTNKREGITREQQDNFAIESYKRALAAQEQGLFKDEIVPVVIKSKKGEVVISEDESPKAVKVDKIPSLRPAFDKNGTVTAANSSSLNDGAACVVIASGEKAKELGAPVVAKIIASADAATAPIDFTIAPSMAIPLALKRAGLKKDDIAKWEINEAFSGVSLANNKILGLDASKVNVRGGAVALGHPIGCSGTRILVTLLNVLKDGEYGVAAICNGGGAATALVIQKTSKVE